MLMYQHKFADATVWWCDSYMVEGGEGTHMLGHTGMCHPNG